MLSIALERRKRRYKSSSRRRRNKAPNLVAKINVLLISIIILDIDARKVPVSYHTRVEGTIERPVNFDAVIICGIDRMSSGTAVEEIGVERDVGIISLIYNGFGGV